MKACGAGLGMALDGFVISFARSDGSRRPEPLAGGWSVATLEPASGFVGAVVAEGTGWHVRRRSWSWPA